MPRAVPPRFSGRTTIVLRAFVVILLFSLWPILTQYSHTESNELRVWFFDVGQGDGIFIETPNGKQILIDGGRDKTILEKLSSVMWPWDRTIDALIATHPDADHITGLVSVLDRYDVETIYETGVRGGTAMIEAFETARKNEHAQNIFVREGSLFTYDGVTFEVYWPTQKAVQTESNRNNTSIILVVSYVDRRVLLTGDAEELVEKEVENRLGDVDVLKLGHHGSKTSSSVSFLKTTKPEIAIISAGVNNSYGHPHPIVLSRLQELGVRVLRTDLDGDILLKTDGNNLLVEPVFLPF